MEEGTVVNLDLNGEKIVLGSSVASKSLGVVGGTNGIINDGVLVITNGDIEYTAPESGQNWNAGTFNDMSAAIRNNGELTLKNVNIDSNVYCVQNIGKWQDGVKTANQEVTVTLDIVGGEYTSSKSRNNDQNGPNAYAIMCVDNAKATISGGAEITGAGGGLAVCWAFADLKDCTITGRNESSTGAHDLYLLGGSVVTYTSETQLTRNNFNLHDVEEYVEKYGECSYTRLN